MLLVSRRGADTNAEDTDIPPHSFINQEELSKLLGPHEVVSGSTGSM